VLPSDPRARSEWKKARSIVQAFRLSKRLSNPCLHRAAYQAGGHLLFGLLGQHRLSRHEQPCNRGCVLQRGADDFGRRDIEHFRRRLVPAISLHIAANVAAGNSDAELRLSEQSNNMCGIEILEIAQQLLRGRRGPVLCRAGAAPGVW
jgi:hypothetical protein